MGNPNQETFRLSKTGIKVYLSLDYHPALIETNLSHFDIVRKARELFSTRYGDVSGLPRICSINSEDAQTWRYFSPLLSMPSEKKGSWIEAFLEEALKRKMNRNLVKMLQEAELMFWRGKRTEPMYFPPPNLGYPEGNTEVDLTIRTQKAVVFVEAKYHSEISMRTKYCLKRDQIIRNIDVGTYYAWSKGLEFYFILIVSNDCDKSTKLLKHYLDASRDIVNRLPHRVDVPKRIEQIVNNLGLITWNQLQKINQRELKPIYKGGLNTPRREPPEKPAEVGLKAQIKKLVLQCSS